MNLKGDFQHNAMHATQRIMQLSPFQLATYTQLLASVALNFTQGAGTSCIACIAVRWKLPFTLETGLKPSRI